jgi:hypothetical protein
LLPTRIGAKAVEGRICNDENVPLLALLDRSEELPKGIIVVAKNSQNAGNGGHGFVDFRKQLPRVLRVSRGLGFRRVP